MLLDFLQLRDRPSSSPIQNKNIRNWLANYPSAIAEEEQSFILGEHDKDLVTSSVRKRTLISRGLQELGMSDLAAKSLPSALRATDPDTEYLNLSIWAMLGEVYLSFVTILMLLLPLWFARLAISSETKLALISAFTLGWHVVVTFGTTLQPIVRSASVASYV